MNREQWQEVRLAQQSEFAQKDRFQQIEAEETARNIAQQHKKHVQNGRYIVANSASCFIDLDVESDGKAGYGSLLSIGATATHGRQFYTEIKPASDRFIQSQHEFCEAHGLERERLLEEGQDLEEAIYDLDVWVHEIARERRPVLSAFNAAFDFSWIDLGYAEVGIQNPFGVAGYCLKSLAMNLGLTSARESRDISYDWKNTTKNMLPPELVPPRDFTHNALEDAIWQQELHFAMVGYQTEHVKPEPSEPHDDGFFQGPPHIAYE